MPIKRTSNHGFAIVMCLGLALCSAAWAMSDAGGTTAEKSFMTAPEPSAFTRTAMGDPAHQNDDIQRELSKATPQQRQLFRQKLGEKLDAMPEAERKRLIEKARTTWKNLPPERRKELIETRRKEIEKMTPDQRKELTKRRREVLSKLPAEDRAAMKQKLTIH